MTQARPATAALVIDGMHATISGITFAWPARCWSCRNTTELVSVGVVLIELTASSSKKTFRWSYKARGGQAPELPSACPACSKDGGLQPGGDWRFLVKNKVGAHPGWPRPWPNDQRMFPLQDEAYSTLRTTYPSEAATADAAIQADAQSKRAV